MTEKKGDYHPQCTSTECFDESENDAKFKLTCSECKRQVHYKCTKLPAYQIQCSLDIKAKKKKGCNQYKSGNCVNVSKDVFDHMALREDLNKSQDVEELAAALERANFRTDAERDKHESFKIEVEADNSVLRDQLNNNKKR